MSFIEILDSIFIGPLKLLFEIIFVIAERFTGHAGLAIIALSLIMNILVLPLYRRADAMQEEAKNVDEKLRDGVAHIKKAFKGDEQMMILQAYYRQNHYKPTDALKGSVSLLLEIPFFMAAYQLLSQTPMLNNISLGPIANLSTPDALLQIGNLSINVLPFIMTGVNVISSAIYLKGYPLKTKIQLYGMALFFLFFLYNSPSGLVFYWTLNNVFSLVKTLFYKLKHPGKILAVLCAAVGCVIIFFGLFVYNPASVLRKILVIVFGLITLIPLLLSLVKNKLPCSGRNGSTAPNRGMYILGSLFITLLTGLLIPSAFIAASPQEYIDPAYFFNPVWFVISAFCLAAGMFMVWMSIFYWLTAPKYKALFEKIVWILCGVMIVNYMCFDADLGLISSSLTFEKIVLFSLKEQAVNLLVLALTAAALFFIISKWKSFSKLVLATACTALLFMSILNIFTINQSVRSAEDQLKNLSAEQMELQLSKNSKNVVVIMLDRAMGEYVPYIMNEKPELMEKFAGFTYYDNTISFGGYTNFAVPALMGGYEYTPVELNKRGDDSLSVKHNEALKVMPVMFMQNGFDVTVSDMSYAGYQLISDMSIFDEYSQISSYKYEEMFPVEDLTERTISNNKRNLFCLSLMKTLPLSIQPTIYSSGTYNQSDWQRIDMTFGKSYEALKNLPNITLTTEKDSGLFASLTFNLTHQPVLLQTPDYVPALSIDNSAYKETNKECYVVDGYELKLNGFLHEEHYHANMASFLLLGNWLDTLRELGVYDNTRIIIVSDHGRDTKQIDELLSVVTENYTIDHGMYFPLLMVKDFGSTEFTVSHEFMTNADVPSIATQHLIESPVNPFTGNPISMEEKTAHDQIILISDDWNILTNNGNTFTPSYWASVSEDLWDPDNWHFYMTNTVLTEHALPADEN